jgi:hypothetical protein
MGQVHRVYAIPDHLQAVPKGAFPASFLRQPNISQIVLYQ